MSLLAHELSGTAVFLTAFACVMAGAEILARRNLLAAETSRKAVHLLGGLICLCFPFLLSSWISVLVLALTTALILYGGERSGALKCLGSVQRKSRGSLYFPLAVLLFFVLGKDRLWLYVSGLLVLVFADTAAALAGTRFGKIHYRTAPNEQKSLEGTVAFMVMAFLSIYLSLEFLGGNIGHTTALLSALLLAILLAGFEAISIGGTDNIFVPVATCYLLLKVTDKPPQELLFQCISLVGVALLLFKINNRRRTFTTRSQIIFLLFSYAAWSLGSAEWMLPAVTGFIIYQLVTKSCDALRNTLGARELLRPLLPHLVILFVANITMQHDFWFAPFLISAAVTTALCAELRFLSDNPSRRLRGLALLCAAVLPTLIPLLLCLPFQGWAVIRALPLLLMISISFTYLYHCAVQLPVNPFVMNYSLPLVSAAAGGICALLQVWGVLKPLDPMTWAEVFR